MKIQDFCMTVHNQGTEDWFRGVSVAGSEIPENCFKRLPLLCLHADIIH